MFNFLPEKIVQSQAITAPAVSVASPAVAHAQVGSSNVQGLQHDHSGLPTPLNRGTCLQPNSTFT